ncbi:hypothetical protein [Glutamicibacter sp. BSL13]
MFESIGESSPELEAVTFTTEDGTKSGTYSRARTGADPADLKSWAEEEYVQWLGSMNDTYESFCGKSIKKLEDYRSCIPTDPHAYIASVEAPARGELLVTFGGRKMAKQYLRHCKNPRCCFCLRQHASEDQQEGS